MIRLILAGLGWVLANLLLFMPRRRVEITLEAADRSRLPAPRRETLNPWLDQWYNGDLAGHAEKPVWVPYHFWFGRRSFDFPPATRKTEELDVGPVRPETREAVLSLLSDRLQRPLGEDETRPETRLDEIGLNSLHRMEVSLQIERRFGFTGDGGYETIGQFLALAEGARRRKPPAPPPPGWSSTPPRSRPLKLNGDTVLRAFIEHALAHPKDVVAADDLAGALTGERLLVGALTLSQRPALAAPNVGVLLPASAACDVALLALHLAGKLPVVLNWTTGPANLAHAARTLSLSQVLTSQAFADRLGVRVEGADYLFLEDLHSTIGKFELLRTLGRIRLRPAASAGRRRTCRRIVPPWCCSPAVRRRRPRPCRSPTPTC